MKRQGAWMIALGPVMGVGAGMWWAVLSSDATATNKANEFACENNLGVFSRCFEEVQKANAGGPIVLAVIGGVLLLVGAILRVGTAHGTASEPDVIERGDRVTVLRRFNRKLPAGFVTTAIDVARDADPPAVQIADKKGFPVWVVEYSLALAESRTYKKCPMCAEAVRSEAKICRFCQYDFAAGTSPSDTATSDVTTPGRR